MPSTGYRELLAWQRAMDLAVESWGIVRLLRAKRETALASQLARAAVSVPANIAEGKGRSSRKEYSRFLSIALGSLREVETLILIAQRIGVDKSESSGPILARYDEVGRLTYGLNKALKRSE